MTYMEYNELAKEYRETDSISRKKEIRDIVFTKAVALCKTLEKLYNKYGQDFVDDSDYRLDRGGYSIEDISSADVSLVYSDHWQNGGECCFGIQVPMLYLNWEARQKLEEELKSALIETLKKEYNNNLKSIEYIKQANVGILGRLKELGSEMEGIEK